jgi:hypothetical protein
MASASPRPAYDAVESGSWWQQVVPAVVGLGGFAIYATLRAFGGNYFQWGPYLSPFYSPLIDVHHHYWPYSPALLILAGPLGFRVTCYYYRQAYYRAFFLDPPACGVPERRGRAYCGETQFPFILQNVHRYFLYVAVIFLAFLWHDAVRGFFFENGIGVGVGSIVLWAGLWCSGRKRSCWQPAGLAKRGGLLRTSGNIPATAWRSPTMPVLI